MNMFVVEMPCPVCGKRDKLQLLGCSLGSAYEGDVFCRRCLCKITQSKWNTRTLTPKQQHADEMYDVLRQVMDWYIYSDGDMPVSMQQNVSGILRQVEDK